MGDYRPWGGGRGFAPILFCLAKGEPSRGASLAALRQFTFCAVHGGREKRFGPNLARKGSSLGMRAWQETLGWKPAGFSAGRGKGLVFVFGPSPRESELRYRAKTAWPGVSFRCRSPVAPGQRGWFAGLPLTAPVRHTRLQIRLCTSDLVLCMAHSAEDCQI